MWTSANLQLPATWLDTVFNTQLKTAINAAILPINKATPNQSAMNASADATRRDNLNLLKKNLDTVIITPWQHGQFSDNKNNLNFWLSPEDAQNYLSMHLTELAWESALLLMVTADTTTQLTQSLNNLLAVFPDSDLEKSLRHATALSTNDNDKLFTSGIKHDRKKSLSIEQLKAFTALSSSSQNIAISEAIASDDNPLTMLSDFKLKRATRLDEIKTAVTNLSSQNGLINYAFHLSGVDLPTSLNNTIPPNPNAPLCCLLAIGGTAVNLQPLLTVVGL